MHDSCATVTFLYFNLFYRKFAKYLHISCATVSIYFIYFCKLANRFKCIVYTYTQILLYIGGKLQSLVITMSSCSVQCIPCSTGSRRVEIIKRIRTLLSQLTSVYKPSRKRRATEKKQVSQEELSRDRTSTVIVFNHIRSNSSLILRCKTIFHEV